MQDYAIFALDPEGYVLTWNAGAERLKGYRREEIVGRHFSQFYPDEAVARGFPEQELIIAAETGRYEDEGWRERKDGTRFWANVIITAIRNPVTGSLVGFSKVTRDLTERRAFEETLRQSEERFRLMVETVEDYAIFALDTKGIIRSWNPGAERLKGYRAKEIVGRHFSRFYTEEDLASGKPQRALETALLEGVFRDESWRVRKDGTRFWANVTITPIRDPHGTLLGFSKITRDLTERRAAHQRLQAAYEEAERTVIARTRALQEANRELEAFTHMTSHDLRAPLRGLTALLDAALDDHADDLTPEVRALVERARSEGARLHGLVESLLSFSRAGRDDVEKVKVNLASLAEETVEILRQRDPDREVEFVVQAAEPGAYHVVADPDLLRLALQNLLGNAWKYTRNQPQARIELGVDLEGENEGVRTFSVQDNGPGFDPAEAPRLFSPFQRLHSRKDFEGTGLGLASVKRIIERHGGRVGAEGVPGEGATFYFTLPIPEDEALTRAEAPPAREAQSREA